MHKVEIEKCIFCDEPTGRAGRDEDSLYCEQCDRGPYCESCWDRHLKAYEVYDEITKNC